MSKVKGHFIVVEGLEGAGKSSAIAIIEQSLKEHGCRFISTREPGGTPLAEAMRSLVKSVTEEKVTIETELLLMYAARSQLIETVIKPNLEQGVWVIGDRHDLSSQAYQGGGRQIPEAVFEPIRQLVLKGFEPELTLYMDIDPKIGLERAKGRGDLDRIELEQLDFFQRTRARYLQLAENNPKIVTIDAGSSMEQVHQQVRRVIEDYMGSVQ